MWRLHLTHYTIQHLDILHPAMLAVWSRRDRIAFYHLETGAALGESVLEAPPFSEETSPEWQTFLNTLKAPNNAVLPLVSTDEVTIYSAEDGKTRLYDWSSETLHWINEGETTELNTKDAQRFMTVDLDRKGCLAAALDGKGQLYLYRPELSVVDTGLSPLETARAELKIARGGEALFVRDRQRILRLDGEGSVKATFNAYYTMGKMACSPDGQRIAISDNDSGVIRVYDGETLTQTHQRFAVDLLEDAVQIQLMADLPPLLVALSALTLDDNGVVAFGVSGFICVTHIDHMDKLTIS